MVSSRRLVALLGSIGCLPFALLNAPITGEDAPYTGIQPILAHDPREPRDPRTPGALCETRAPGCARPSKRRQRRIRAKARGTVRGVR